jgi:transcriptional regulator with XRE-family HTH domain
VILAVNIDIFVQNIKNLSKKKGVSVTAALRESGAGRSLIDHVRKGSIPSLEKVQLLAAYFGVTTSELLGEREDALTMSSLYTPPQESYEDLLETLQASSQRLGLNMVYHVESCKERFQISQEAPVYVHFQAEIIQRTPVPESTAQAPMPTGSSLTPAQQKLLDTMIAALADLNEEGRKKLMDYASDLVASGRYKK